MENENCVTIHASQLKERDHLDHTGIDRKVITSLKETGCENTEMDVSQLGKDSKTLFRELGKEPYSSKQCDEFLDHQTLQNVIGLLINK